MFISIYTIKIASVFGDIFPFYLDLLQTDAFDYLGVGVENSFNEIQDKNYNFTNSDSDNDRAVDKGKGRAIDNNNNGTSNKRAISVSSSSEEERQIKKAKLESLKDNTDDNNNYVESSKTGSMRDIMNIDPQLLSEEDRELQKAIYLSYNSESANIVESSENSEYSVYSSEEHSDDSDNTKSKKREIKKTESNLPKKKP
jgi:hypothetical protein